MAKKTIASPTRIEEALIAWENIQTVIGNWERKDKGREYLEFNPGVKERLTQLLIQARSEDSRLPVDTRIAQLQAELVEVRAKLLEAADDYAALEQAVDQEQVHKDRTEWALDLLGIPYARRVTRTEFRKAVVYAAFMLKRIVKAPVEKEEEGG